MDITLSLNIEESIAKAIAPEKLAPILDRHITDAISSAIKSATDYSSPFRKALEKQLADALPQGLGIDHLAKFQQVLNQTITNAVRESNTSAISVALEKAAKLSAIDAPARVKMSEIIKLYRGQLHIEDHESFYALFEPSDFGGGHLFLDEELSGHRRLGRYGSKDRLAFTKEGQVYSLALDEKHITPACRPMPISKFDELALALYVGRTSIDVDLTPDQVEEAAMGQGD